jgi:uncharacterized protein YhaN
VILQSKGMIAFMKNKKIIISSMIAAVCVVIFVGLVIYSSSQNKLPIDQKIKLYLQDKYSSEFENITYLDTVHREEQIISSEVTFDGASFGKWGPDKKIPEHDSVYYTAYNPENDIEFYVEYESNEPDKFFDTYSESLNRYKRISKIYEKTKSELGDILSSSYVQKNELFPESNDIIGVYKRTAKNIKELNDKSGLLVENNENLCFLVNKNLNFLCNSEYYEKLKDLNSFMDSINETVIFSSINVITQDGYRIAIAGHGSATVYKPNGGYDTSKEIEQYRNK